MEELEKYEVEAPDGQLLVLEVQENTFDILAIITDREEQPPCH